MAKTKPLQVKMSKPDAAPLLPTSTENAKVTPIGLHFGDVPDGVPLVKSTHAIIEVPLGEVSQSEYLSSHVSAKLKTQEQRMAWKRLIRGLQQSGATTKDGRFVQRPYEAIRWMMEQISESD